MMLKTVYKVDEQGFIMEYYASEFKDGVMITDFEDKRIIPTDLPSPNNLYMPKWNGEEWVEGETAEEKAEREEREANQPAPPPSLEEQLTIKDKQIQMLQVQLQASTDRADFQEEVLTEIIMALNA